MTSATQPAADPTATLASQCPGRGTERQHCDAAGTDRPAVDDLDARSRQRGRNLEGFA